MERTLSRYERAWREANGHEVPAISAAHDEAELDRLTAPNAPSADATTPAAPTPAPAAPAPPASPPAVTTPKAAPTAPPSTPATAKPASGTPSAPAKNK